MSITIRPSKMFLYEVLARELGKARSGYGLDAAAADMKNRWMFKTDAYVGLDIDAARLEAGLRRAGPGPAAWALEADMTGRVPLPDGFFQAVVSSNTLYCLSEPARLAAIAELARLTAPGGVLLCETPIDDDAARLLAEAFRDVHAVYFKNPFSRFYERLFEDDRGWLGSHPIAGARPFRLLAWLISRLEYLTAGSRSMNAHVLYVCRGKKGAAAAPDRSEAGRRLAAVARRA